MHNSTPRSLAAITAIAFVLAGCSSTESSSGGDAGNIPLITAGKLTVCSNPPFEPFEMTGANGEVTGFDIDLVKEVAKDLKLEVATVSTGFEGIQSGLVLDTNKCDIIASGITITPERQTKVDFSQPYYDSYLGLLVPADSKITSIETAQGKTIAVQQANTGETYAVEHGLKTIQFEDVGLQAKAVETGQADGALNDLAVMAEFAKNNKDLKIAAEIASGEQMGLGVRKGNAELLTQINKTLERTKSDGTYTKVYKQWFGEEPKK